MTLICPNVVLMRTTNQKRVECTKKGIMFVGHFVWDNPLMNLMAVCLADFLVAQNPKMVSCKKSSTLQQLLPSLPLCVCQSLCSKQPHKKTNLLSQHLCKELNFLHLAFQVLLHQQLALCCSTLSKLNSHSQT